MNLLEINLLPIQNYLNNINYTDLAINEENSIWCKSLNGTWLEKQDQNLNRKYLQGLFRLLATNANKEIIDIDNFHENLDIISNNITHRAVVEFGGDCGAGFSISIRLKRNKTVSLNNFIFTKKDDKAKLIKLIQNKQNILISGGTGSGKTTFLNCLLDYTDKSNRVIAVENTSEIDINKFPNHKRFIYQKDEEQEVLKSLNTSFRSIPDILILGEIRQENSLPFLRFLNSGHDGTLSTIHASSPKGAISAIATNIASVHSNRNITEIQTELKERLGAVVQLKVRIINKENENDKNNIKDNSSQKDESIQKKIKKRKKKKIWVEKVEFLG